MVGAATAWYGPLGGVVEQGMVILRSPRNLGGLPSSFVKAAARASLKQKVQASGSRVRYRLDPNDTNTRVHCLQREWMGQEKSESSHSTGETGERAPSGACGGKGKIGLRCLRRER